MELERNEIISLFYILKKHEDELNSDLIGFKNRLEKEIYSFMSIDALEKLLSRDTLGN